MESRTGPGRFALAAAYLSAAFAYWLYIFPRVRREMLRARARAERIPDPRLRALALDALSTETAQAEGVGAFVILAPRASRTTLVRAVVAFATLFDYVDALAERPSGHAIANSRQLHQAMLVALTRDAPHVDYYAHCRDGDDGGYLRELVENLRASVDALPSYPQAAALARGLGEQIVQYQSLNLSERNGGHANLAQWARSTSSPDDQLYWWERAAGSIRAVSMLALIGAAAQPSLTIDDARAVCAAYALWVDALATLLDSVVDESEDAAAEQRSLVSYYASTEEAARRLRFMADEAVRALNALPNAAQHLVILVGIVGSYASRMPPTPAGKAIATAVLKSTGFLAKPTALIFRARSAASRLGATSLRARRPSSSVVGSPALVERASLDA